ncbi:MAG TPA: serine/threonine-protein kinase, partial [Planctomycetaceae bacterium]|nr:serine/threonine-protein kinase [Planctomycetaceae bacterium]
EALACLDHKNVSRILDVGVAGGCPYFATEYAANGTIRDYATRHDKSIEWCVDALRQIAFGVHHANTRSMIHRDIKPANILVMHDETPKITDFGLVKFRARVRDLATASRAPLVEHSFRGFDVLLNQYADELPRPYAYPEGGQPAFVDSLRLACLERTGLPKDSIDRSAIEEFLETIPWEDLNKAGLDELPPFPLLDDLTHPGAVLGSPQFMAPEQVAGDLASIGPRTDVYGLGATLYWLLTGEPVAVGRDLREIFRKIQTEFPKPVLELNARVPEAVECVVWKAIQKDPPRRYENCKVLAEELQCCLEGKKPAAQASRERHREAMSLRQARDKEKYDNLFLQAFPPKTD